MLLILYLIRYSLLGFKNARRQAFGNVREEASALATALKLGNYQIGKTKIFFKSPRAVSWIKDYKEKRREKERKGEIKSKTRVSIRETNREWEKNAEKHKNTLINFLFIFFWLANSLMNWKCKGNCSLASLLQKFKVYIEEENNTEISKKSRKLQLLFKLVFSITFSSFSLSPSSPLICCYLFFSFFSLFIFSCASNACTPPNASPERGAHTAIKRRTNTKR